MKYTFRLIIAALAAAVVLVSCAKELNPGKVDTDPADGTLRTVAVSFDTPTKSYLDGRQPCFSQGDSILVSDFSGLDTCVVKLMGKQTIIKTKLKGSHLKAVYPYTAAKIADDNKDINDVKIPDIQTGRFADANICMADQKLENNFECLVFRNKVAILKFYADETIGVDAIKVSCSAEDIAYNSTKITVFAPESDDSQEPDPFEDPRIWYVAMKDIKDATSLTFESTTKTQGPVTKTPKAAPGGDNSIVKGCIYNVFIPYYIEVKLQVGNPQKWAYCNVGAFLPEEYGDYFAWGETTGHKANAEKTGFVDNHMFSWANCPFNGEATDYNSEYFTEVKDVECPNGVLAPKNDAASVQWSGKWRMPTVEEWENLIKYTNTTSTHFSNGKLAINNSSLIIPAAGLGMKGDNTLDDTGYLGRYWSSTLSNENLQWACTLAFGNGDPGKGASTRIDAQPIRPIYDETITDDKTATVTISAYTNGGTL